MQSSQILTFDAEQVRKQIIAAMRSQHHMATFAELFEPAFHHGGVVKMDESGLPDTQNIDLTRVGPRLWLVRDHYIYLMANGRPAIGEGPMPAPAYANETNPEVMSFHASNQVAKRLFGDQPLAVSIPVRPLLSAIRARRRTVRIEIRTAPMSFIRRFVRRLGRFFGCGDIAATIVIPNLGAGNALPPRFKAA